MRTPKYKHPCHHGALVQWEEIKKKQVKKIDRISHDDEGSGDQKEGAKDYVGRGNSVSMAGRKVPQ